MMLQSNYMQKQSVNLFQLGFEPRVNIQSQKNIKIIFFNFNNNIIQLCIFWLLKCV